MPARASTHSVPKPIRADARRNRDQIITVAAELIDRDGLAVPLDEIARQAGVGAGTVHRHFPSKESLYAAIVVDRVAGVVRTVRSLARDDAEPDAALVDALTTMLAEGARSRALKAALAGMDFDLRVAAPELAVDLHAAVGDLLTSAQAARTIRTDLNADDIMSLVAGAFAAIQHSGDDPLHAERLTAVLFDGLRTTAPPQAK